MRLAARARIGVSFVMAACVGMASATPGTVERVVVLRDVHVSATDVTGMIENVSDDTITSVRVVVSERFLWANERSPGPDDPSRARVETLDVRVAPGAAMPFRLARPPLPPRTDGRFVTTVEAIGVATRSGAEAAGVGAP